MERVSRKNAEPDRKRRSAFGERRRAQQRHLLAKKHVCDQIDLVAVERDDKIGTRISMQRRQPWQRGDQDIIGYTLCLDSHQLDWPGMVEASSHHTAPVRPAAKLGIGQADCAVGLGCTRTAIGYDQRQGGVAPAIIGHSPHRRAPREPAAPRPDE